MIRLISVDSKSNELGSIPSTCANLLRSSMKAVQLAVNQLAMVRFHPSQPLLRDRLIGRTVAFEAMNVGSNPAHSAIRFVYSSIVRALGCEPGDTSAILIRQPI